MIFVSQLSCFPASAKKNETPPNTRDYMVPYHALKAGLVTRQIYGWLVWFILKLILTKQSFKIRELMNAIWIADAQ